MDGIRDRGMVESALARPANLARYGNADAADLAAAYAWGIAEPRLPRRQQTHRMDGIRDRGMVESALARPANLARYGNADAADLAAAYAWGIAKNHGFLDGNKRTAWVTARLFLADNGRHLEFDPAAAIRTMEAVAAGRIGETELAGWFRSHTT